MTRATAIRVFVAGAALLLSFASHARAGDRRLEILLVDMTPDAVSNAASSACVADLRKVIAQDYVSFSRMGETRFRELIGATDRSKPFMGWSGSQLKAARESGKLQVDTVLAVDCRPEARSVDILVATYDDGTTTIRLRDVPLSAKRLAWLAREVLRHAWVGFNV